MKILIVGGGGREHALAWQASRSPLVTGVVVAPGNAGTAAEPGTENAPVAADDIDGLLELAQERAIDLTIIGPEAPLVAGIVDRFTAAGLRCFGPGAPAAQLEGSKSFTKAFLERHGIPTAAYATFTELDPALEYVRARGAPIVIKADGLAAGKGVIVARELADAETALTDMLSGDAFGKAGRQVVVEEFLDGEEASFIVMCDGRNVLPMATSQDHKPIGNGDTGPNTGGMGAYSPAPVVTDAVYQRIMTEVIEPTVAGMAAEGHPYVGFLYAGLMITADGTPKVIEFNCRFGDPETQPILLRLRSDLVAHCLAAMEHHLDRETASWDPRVALGVVLAADGYPGSYRKGLPISGLDTPATDDLKVFHAGTLAADDAVLTNGGRVLCVTALGDTVAEASRRAYRRAEQITWHGVYYRTDIGHRAIARETA